MNAQTVYSQIIQEVEASLPVEMRPLFQQLLPGIEAQLLAKVEERLAAVVPPASPAPVQMPTLNDAVLDSTWRLRTEPHHFRFETPCWQGRGTVRTSTPCATPWLGVSGLELSPDKLVLEARVVTREGLHGTIQRVEDLFSPMDGIDPLKRNEQLAQQQSTWGNLPGFKPFATVFYHVQLDSGRTVRVTRPLYAEMERPLRVIPDLFLDDRWLNPEEAWGWLTFLYESIERLKTAIEHEPSETHRRPLREGLQHWRPQYLTALNIWAEWYAQNYPLTIADSYPARQLKAGLYRRMQLEQGAPERFPRELGYLSAVTAFYHEQLRPNSRVKAWVFDSGTWQEVEDEVQAFEQPDIALLKSGRRTLVCYLRLQPSNRRVFTPFV